jgi:hypothetical protein
MTKDQLEGVLEEGGATKTNTEWKLPEGVGVSFHVSRGGGGVPVAKVETLRIDKTFIVAVTGRGDRFGFDLADVVAVQIEGAKGQAPRRAGF